MSRITFKQLMQRIENIVSQATTDEELNIIGLTLINSEIITIHPFLRKRLEKIFFGTS